MKQPLPEPGPGGRPPEHDKPSVLSLRLVVMGVSGCGKSTLAQALANALGLAFIEGDHLHPPENIQLMASGIALNDHNREAWLRTIAQHLGDSQRGDSQRGDSGVVIACSALKRSYRDLLRGAASDVRFIHLHGAPELIATRLRARSGHYMPPALLDSQLAALEPPGADEQGLSIDIAPAPAEILQQLLGLLQAQRP